MMRVNKILIIGGDSSIGNYLFDNLDRKFFQITKTTRKKSFLNEEIVFLDLENVDESDIVFSQYDIVIFCAALTSTLECESNPEKAYLINYSNTLFLVKKIIENNVFVILFSTTQVFSGNNKIEYLNSSKNPISIYGKTKELLEFSLNPYLSKISILRCTKVIFKSNQLFRNWISQLNQHNLIFPFNDIYFSPISIEYLFDVILEIIRKKIVGLNQISSKDLISFSEAAFYLSENLNLNSSLIRPKCFQINEGIYIPQYSFLMPTLIYPNIPMSTAALDYFIKD
jgi:dTDP-4-dehydrorhamnose reductase